MILQKQNIDKVIKEKIEEKLKKKLNIYYKSALKINSFYDLKKIEYLLS